jgi:GTPase SAR1 family protein
MIGQRYKEKKIAVLDVWRRYCLNRGTGEDGVDPAFLKKRAEALEEGKYILAVVGEAKAGKSTLINALLGERILPTDVLQSSSAIVEIFKSEKKFVEVRYADGRSENIYDDLGTPDVDEAFEHLRRIGALQDRFRGIPTTIIDTYIVQGRIKAGRRIPLADLEAASKLPLAGKDALIEEYVKGRTLAHIPVEIRFGFPLKNAFDEFRLVDSPGVNALGGVEDKTFAYLHKANAVLFVHSLEGHVEKSSFREFITQVVPNRTRQALFLVLTKAGLEAK